ncbi:MAG: sulfite exporter TauE/SafE family protein [Deltaproteobacteria bacterium]|nr:sulfite exporter TauE/SafE family protein [Deltaproteobacteria bacterium]
MTEISYLAAVVLVAFVVESAAGFGATVVTVTLGAQILPLDAVLAAFLPVNVALSLVLTVRNAKAIDRGLLLRQVLPWMGAGTAVGLALSRYRAAGWIKVVFAAFVIVLSIAELLAMRARADQRSTPLRPTVAASALAGAGVIHGLFACGGPLVVYVVGRTLSEKAAFRATLSALWLVMNVVLVASMAIDGSLGGKSLVTSAALLPPLVVGLLAGDRLHHRMPERAFRVAVFALLLVAATVLVVRSV